LFLGGRFCEAVSAGTEGGQERGGSGVVAEGFTDVGEAVDVSWGEDETATQLEGAWAELVLVMAGRAGTVAALKIVAASEVQQVARAQAGDGVGVAIFVD